MSESEGFDPNDPIRWAERAEEQYPRPVGSSLPKGIRSLGSPTPLQAADPERPAASPLPQGRALTSSSTPHPSAPNSSSTPGDHPSTMQRAVNVFRLALPFVQRVLPLLDGNVGTAVSNFLVPRPPAHQPPPPAPPPPPPVNLAPIEKALGIVADGIGQLQSQHRDLRNQFAEQTTALKRVDDQLLEVREATDRNTLEQQELLEDLKGVGKKVNVLAFVGLSLLGLSVILNVLLFLHLWHIIP